MCARHSIVLTLIVGTCACGGAGPTSASAIRAARTVFVASTGSDQNEGSLAGPLATLRYAIAQLHPGDTLYVRGGTYTGDLNTVDSQLGTVPSGRSSSEVITIAGYAGEAVTIRPPHNVAGIRLTSAAPAYLVFQDFTIDMSNSTAGADADAIFSDGGHHNRFQRLVVMNSRNFGIHFGAGSPFNEVIGCRIHDNGTVGADTINGHGLYISSSDNLFDGNEVFNNQGYGLHLYNNAGPRNVSRNTIRNNTVHDNGRHGGTAYGVVVAWGDANAVANNQLYANPGGIQVYTDSSNALVSGNTIYSNKPLEGIVIQFATGTVVRDNVIYDNGTDILDLGTASTLSNNGPRP